jgi:hypothetical protein
LDKTFFYDHQPSGSDIDLIVFYVVLKFDEKLFPQLENDFVKKSSQIRLRRNSQIQRLSICGIYREKGCLHSLFFLIIFLT